MCKIKCKIEKYLKQKLNKGSMLFHYNNYLFYSMYIFVSSTREQQLCFTTPPSSPISANAYNKL